MSNKTTISYVTCNTFKHEENAIFVAHCKFADGKAVKDLFEFEFNPVSIPEILEVNIEQMVKVEVCAAYAKTRVPCIVEHAGLVFEDFKADWYPGGLTKPMWNTLKDRFVTETASANRRATARAVIGYCDGMEIFIFTGETAGTIAATPKGNRKFYWDTVFVPDDPTGKSNSKTYAEINDDPDLGLSYKVVHLSQSTRAMLLLLEFLRNRPPSKLWR